jgi:RHS repeat-associated protein
VSGGQSIARTYDNDGLLTQAGSLLLTRDPQNGFVTASSNGAVGESYGYTSFGEIVSHIATQNGSQVYSASYTQDALGRISGQTESVLGVSHTYGYSYDNAQRLSQVTRDGSVVSSYTYDLNGNRLSAILGGVTSSATYDAQDRLMTYGTFSYVYNAQGQLVSKTDSAKGQITSYNYDVLGNLRSVTLPDGKVISYLVDGANRRIGKQVNGTLVQGFLYLDDLRIAAELDGSGNVVSQFVYGDKVNVPAYMIKAGVTYQIISNHLGSPRLIINSTDGSVAQQIEYDEFGNVLADSNPGFQPYGFGGGIYNSETGLSHFDARDYDATVGRWLQKDPSLFAAADTNLYGYVFEDPVNLIDPTGLVCNYSQGSGRLVCTNPDGQKYLDKQLYSGQGPFRNDPLSQGVPNAGPIPRGMYVVGPAIPRSSLGPNVRQLIPFPQSFSTQPIGRTPGSYYLHGDNPDTIGNSSHGCPILNGSKNRLSIPTGEIFNVTQ